MTAKDDSHMLALHRDAESQGRSIKVFHYCKEKSPSAIPSYLRNMRLDHHEQWLLAQCSGPMPKYISVGSPHPLYLPHSATESQTLVTPNVTHQDTAPFDPFAFIELDGRPKDESAPLSNNA